TGVEVSALLRRRAFLADRSDDDLLRTRFALDEADLLEQRHLSGPEGWIPVLRMLHRPGGPGATLHLDEWGQALLGGCRGTVDLGTQIAILATAHQIDADAL